MPKPTQPTGPINFGALRMTTPVQLIQTAAQAPKKTIDWKTLLNTFNPEKPFAHNKVADNPAAAGALLTMIDTTIENTFGAPAYLASGGNPLTGKPLIKGGGSIPRGFTDQVKEAYGSSGLPYAKESAPYVALAAGFMGTPGGKAKVAKGATNLFGKTDDALVAAHQVEEKAREYLTRYKNVINTDNARELFPSYVADRSKSAAIHEDASTVAKKAYEFALQDNKGARNNTVLFTAGGTGAGKSSALGNVADEFAIVYDGNLNKLDSAKKKIDAALAQGYDAHVTYVFNDVSKALDNALARASRMEAKEGSGRTVPLKEHLDTHIGSQGTLLQLLKEYDGRVYFDAVDNSGDAPKYVTTVAGLLRNTRYNTPYEQLYAKLAEQINEAHKSGRISAKTRDGFLSDAAGASASTKTVPANAGKSPAGATQPTDSGLAEVSRVADNLQKHNVGLPRRDAEAMARDVIANRPYNKKAAASDLDATQTGGPPGGKPPRGGKTGLSSEGPSPEGGLPGGTGPTKSSSPQGTPSKYGVNTKALDVSPESKQLIEDLNKDLSPAVAKKGPLTHQEIIDFAEAHPNLVSDDILRENTLRFNAAVLNARKKLATIVEKGGSNADVIDAWTAVQSSGTDAGRVLEARKINAGPTEENTLTEMISLIYKTNKDIDAIKKAAEGVDFTNAKQAADFYRKFVKPTAGDWIDLIRYNSMLSSPKTHIVNIASNFLNVGAVAPIEKTLTGTLDFLGSKITGKDRKAFAGEGAVYAAHAAANIKEAAFRFADVMRGKSAQTNLDTRHIPIATKGLKGGVVTTLGFPSRLLEGMDQFFTAMAEGGQKGALKYRASKGVDVDDIAGEAAKDAAYRLYRQKPLADGQGRLLDAVDQFTVMVQGLRNNDNPIVSTVAKFTVPFLQTPMNIFKQGLEFSPVGFATLPGSADKTTQLSRAIIGSSVFAGAATLLASNRITWGEPINATDKANWRASGMQAYSVKIGNKWVSYQKLPPPLAFPIAMVAAIHDTQRNKKLDDNTTELVLSGIAKYGQFLSDQSYAKSIGDLLAAAKGGEAGVERVISNYGQQLVPFRALGGWLARLTDEVQRKPDSAASFVDQQVQLLMMNIPGLSDNVPARLDNAGNPIPQQFPTFNAFSPVGVTEQTPEQEKQYQDYTTIGQLNRQNTAISGDRNDLAASEWEKIQSLPTNQEKRAYLTEIAESDPELAKKIIAEAKKPTGLSPVEKKLSSASVATRAAFIAQELKNMKTNAEKRAYIEDLYTKKIVTKEVIAQLAKLLKQ